MTDTMQIDRIDRRILALLQAELAAVPALLPRRLGSAYDR